MPANLTRGDASGQEQRTMPTPKDALAALAVVAVVAEVAEVAIDSEQIERTRN